MSWIRLIGDIGQVNWVKAAMAMDKGFWTMAHDYRADLAMTLSLIVNLLLGAGDWYVKFTGHR